MSGLPEETGISDHSPFCPCFDCRVRNNLAEQGFALSRQLEQIPENQPQEREKIKERFGGVMAQLNNFFPHKFY